MEANEFVKKYGWDYSKLFSNGWITFDNDCEERNVSRDEVKKLVESWEFVELCGGVGVVKQHLKDGNVFRFEETPLMKQAIADVESCQ